MDGLDAQCGQTKRNSGRVARDRHSDGSRCHRQGFGWWKPGILSCRRGQRCRRVPAVRLFGVKQTMDSLMPNQPMKPNAPWRNDFSVFATTPRISSRCPASLVRLKLVLCPHSLAPTLVILPSMSLGPPLHSLGSRTPGVMLSNASRGLSLSL
jgi:hypothetical protein